MDLLPFFQWCEETGLGAGVRQSQWLFPFIEALHLVAFAVLGGTILLVDFRLLGFGLKRQPARELAREAQPFLTASLAVMLVTGILLFLSEAVKCYYSNPFWIKMFALAGGIVFTYTARRMVLRRDETQVSPLVAKAVAVVSIVLWGTVAWGGRWIGFSG